MRRLGHARQVEHGQLGRAVGVADRQLHQEPVELRLGERVRPLVLDRVLRGQDPEGLGEDHRLVADGDLPFLHGLEQGALDLGRGAVDLVGEQDAGDDRPGTDKGNNVDNDALLDLVRLLESRGDEWGIVVISKSGGTLETAAAFRILLRELRGTLGRRAAASWASCVIPVTGTSGKLFELAKALGCPEMFDVPDGVGGRFSMLSAVGLLPAALMGLDVVRLLEGRRGDERALPQQRARGQHRAAVRGRVPPDGSAARVQHPRAEHVGQAAGGGRALVRPAAGARASASRSAGRCR